ncbi:molybdopterin molybdotransferase MoeA [Bacillus shivajii]|uniref:molybdopterin molybdotransferase MoeA n=1 Tax=Bacillus shivajii TaxID=1983719 RepID=UPI001CFC4285|nr:gephyrin-like molybdotransferase Glp [Bacillus shivajii]UCZ52388.1 molybdopterin molybdotransferase MoeA [Bacillus shivajii]
MKFFRVQSVEKMTQIMDENIKSTNQIEEVPIHGALHRVLAEDVLANEDVPPFSRSVVDGYAVVAKDTFGVSESMPGFLQYIGEVEMGKGVDKKVRQGEAMYVPTGGMLPPGADAVVMIEDCEVNRDLVNVQRSVAKNENVIFQGEDATKGDLLLRKGKRLRAQELGAIASMGYTNVKVKKQVTVGYLSSGDEIVPHEEEEISGGQVRDVNGVTIPVLSEQWGYNAVVSSIARDDYDDFYEKAKALFETCDAVVISGGSSVGTRDYTTDVIEALGDGDPGILAHGVSVKPGKPTIFSMSSNKPILGLPGHPASAMVIYQLFGKRMLSNLQGEDQLPTPTVTRGVVSQNIPSAPGRTDYIRVKLTKQDDGRFEAVPVLGKSGLVKTLVDSDGLLEIEEKKEGVRKGEDVPIHLFT